LTGFSINRQKKSVKPSKLGGRPTKGDSDAKRWSIKGDALRMGRRAVWGRSPGAI